MKVLVTGASGFIGFHTCKKLIEAGHDVVGLDNLNSYYDVNLKLGRLKALGVSKEQIVPNTLIEASDSAHFHFYKGGLEDRKLVEKVFSEHSLSHICHLGAQAGVRYSLEAPQEYIDSNITGTLNILECCRQHSPEHLVYASSSSVYGLNESVPFKTTDPVDHPISLYAASKRSNELMAHTYSHLFGIPTTGLRFFTVYGPWGRPDMALFKFVKGIIDGKEIEVFNNGEMQRDFTYVDDIVEGIVRLLPKAPEVQNLKTSNASPVEEPNSSSAPFRVFNIGNSQPVALMDFLGEIESALNMKAKIKMMPMQAGDVSKTWADVDDLFQVTEYRPRVNVKEGVREFVNWYREFYKV